MVSGFYHCEIQPCFCLGFLIALLDPIVVIPHLFSVHDVSANMKKCVFSSIVFLAELGVELAVQFVLQMNESLIEFPGLGSSHCVPTQFVDCLSVMLGIVYQGPSSCSVKIPGKDLESTVLILFPALRGCIFFPPSAP